MEENNTNSQVNTSSDLYKKAQSHVNAIKGFYSHFASFVFVIILLAIINLVTSPQYWWFLWVVFGWGIGIFWHAVGVFGFGKMGSDWEQRKIQEYMEKNN